MHNPYRPSPNTTDDVNTGSRHWYVSYNRFDRADYGCDTTALVLGQMEYFIVLNGDHRKELQAAIDARDGGRTSGLARCLAYVRSHKDQLNFRSEPVM